MKLFSTQKPSPPPRFFSVPTLPSPNGLSAYIWIAAKHKANLSKTPQPPPPTTPCRLPTLQSSLLGPPRHQVTINSTSTAPAKPTHHQQASLSEITMALQSQPKLSTLATPQFSWQKPRLFIKVSLRRSIKASINLR